MRLSIEKIVEMVTREVIKELIKQGYKVNQSFEEKSEVIGTKKILEVDMSGFKTPILTETSFDNIAPDTQELVVPERTIITPGASNIIKRNKIKISYKSNKN